MASMARMAPRATLMANLAPAGLGGSRRIWVSDLSRRKLSNEILRFITHGKLAGLFDEIHRKWVDWQIQKYETGWPL